MNDESTSKPIANRWASRLATLSPHFAVVSALSLIIAVFCSTVFLYGYLSVFDWHLIWIIEYADVLKFGLVVVAVVSGFVFYINSITDDVFIWTTENSDHNRTALKVTGAFVFLWIVVYVVNDEISKTPYWGLHLHVLLSAVFLALITFKFVTLSRAQSAIDTRTLLNELAYFVAAIYIFGSTLGYYVRDVGDYRQAVTLKDATLEDVQVIMITSHHIVLYSNEQTITVPSADVIKIVSKRAKP